MIVINHLFANFELYLNSKDNLGKSSLGNAGESKDPEIISLLNFD